MEEEACSTREGVLVVGPVDPLGAILNQISKYPNVMHHQGGTGISAPKVSNTPLEIGNVIAQVVHVTPIEQGVDSNAGPSSMLYQHPKLMCPNNRAQGAIYTTVGDR